MKRKKVRVIKKPKRVFSIRVFFVLFMATLQINIASASMGIDITDALKKKEVYLLDSNQVSYTRIDETFDFDGAQGHAWFTGNKCTSDDGKKCVFRIMIANHSSSLPYLRIYNHENRSFYLFNEHDKSRERVNGAKLISLPDAINGSHSIFLEYEKTGLNHLSSAIYPEKEVNIINIIYFMLYMVAFLSLFLCLASYKLYTQGKIIELILVSSYFILMTIIFSSLFISPFDIKSEKYQISMDFFDLKEMVYFPLLLAIITLNEFSHCYLSQMNRLINYNRFFNIIFFLICIILYNIDRDLNLVVGLWLMLCFLYSLYNIYASYNYVGKLYYSFLSYYLCTVLLFVNQSALEDFHISLFQLDYLMPVITVFYLFPLIFVFYDLHKSKMLIFGQGVRLKDGSEIDFLTGLNNAVSFTVKMDKYNEYISCYYINITNLSSINTDFGQTVGDRYLIEFSEWITNLASDYKAKVFRMQGDEFLILSKIEINFSVFDESSKYSNIPLPVRVGYCMNDSDSIDVKVSKSEYSCRLAKKNNIPLHKWSSYDDEVNTYCLPRYFEKAKLFMTKDHIVCYAQKIESRDSSKNNKIELLCRFQPDLDSDKIRPAYTILNIVDSHSLHSNLDLVMLEHAWNLLGQLNTNDSVSVNIFPKSLFDDRVIESINLIASTYPSRLTIEITEHFYYEADEAFFSTIDSLKRKGVSISLDDFGAGYSSYSILSSGHFNELKLDGSLIKKMSESKFSTQLVESIAQLAHAGGLTVTAEFVENEEIRNLLFNIGVDYLQGYFIHKPEPIDDYLKLLSSVAQSTKFTKVP